MKLIIGHLMNEFCGIRFKSMRELKVAVSEHLEAKGIKYGVVWDVESLVLESRDLKERVIVPVYRETDGTFEIF